MKLLFFFFFIALNAYSSESMRHCMLLPIIDGGDGQLGFKIFENVEEYIKESSWCVYKSNSELINILGQYSKNLEGHLENKDVLKVVADKTKAGSLIKVSLKLEAGSTEVSIEILGENGEDRYLKEKTSLKSNDIALISQTIKNWLELYDKTIPYEGRVKGILGDQFTIDIGKKSNLYQGSAIIIERPESKRQHPLLKEIVEYQTEKIAEAKVFDVSDTQAQAKIINYEGQKKLKLEDWVRVRAKDKKMAIEQLTAPEKYIGGEKEDYGKLGTIGIFLNIGKGSSSQSGSSDKSMAGLLYGADIETEIWATRNYWLGLDIEKKMGSYSKTQGSFASDSNSTNNSTSRFKVGYKYLPMGFFYGPQLDLFFGYGSYGYGLSTSLSDSLTDVSFSGLLLGAKGSVPLFESLRLYIILDFLLTSSYQEQVEILGPDISSSNYHFELGGLYYYAQNISFSSGVSVVSNKASFSGSIKEEQFKDVSVKIGTVFTF